jgi:hypothetical protein
MAKSESGRNRKSATIWKIFRKQKLLKRSGDPRDIPEGM